MSGPEPPEAPFFHVGILVADLDAAVDRFSEALGLTFAPVMDGPVELRGDGGELRLTMRATYSVEGPPHIELIQGQTDGIFSLAGGERLHHLGRWSPSRDELADAHVCLPTLYSVHQVPGQPPGMWLTDPAELHGVIVEFVDENSRPILEAWISGEPPG
jgi:catechol 2,3-dioxygenase-like lactoylglutathione lyase family enzyme